MRTAWLLASDGAEWTAPARGLYRGTTEYFASKRYLADDEVVAILPDFSRGMWVRTRTGVSHIELREMTLEQKAAAFEERITLRHDRYGMVADSHLSKAGDLSTNQLESTDNDGLWTAMYGAAECFRYAVTKDPDALTRARKAIDAVLFLEEVTGVPGLAARSYVKKGDATAQETASGIGPPTSQIQWKGDTSSDESVGHFFLFEHGVRYDRRSGTEGSAWRRRPGCMMDYIVWAHRYNLIDVTGDTNDVGQMVARIFRGEG